jgi:hypothetical protein
MDVGPKMEEEFFYLGGGPAGWPHGDLNFMQITNAQDIWFWKHDATRIFFVKPAYSVVELVSRVDVVPLEVSRNLYWPKCESLGHHLK